MKKVFMTMAVFTGLVAGGMVFSSFTNSNKTEATPSIIEILYFPHITRIGNAYIDRNLVCKFSAE